MFVPLHIRTENKEKKKTLLGFNYIINLFKCRAYPIKYEISYTFI